MEHTKISEQFDILTWIPKIHTYMATSEIDKKNLPQVFGLKEMLTIRRDLYFEELKKNSYSNSILLL